jgi:hypothetical protein
MVKKAFTAFLPSPLCEPVYIHLKRSVLGISA